MKSHLFVENNNEKSPEMVVNAPKKYNESH